MEKRIKINGYRDIEVESFELDERLQEGQCLISTHCSMISPGTELSRAYALKKGATYPNYPGYCSVGTIIEAKSHESIKKGDRVLFSGNHASKHVFEREKSDGGILYSLNDHTTDEEGCFLMMCWIAANGILPVNVSKGNKVGIFGLGNLGLILSALYLHEGCEVYAIDPVKTRCQRAVKLGVKHIVDVPFDQQISAIKEMTNDQGFDIVIDASGNSACIATCVESAKDFAQVVLLGSPRVSYEMDVTPVFNQIHMKMLTVIGAMNRRYPFYEEDETKLSMMKYLKVLEQLLNNKVIDIDHFISHHVLPENILSAYDGLMNDKENYLGVIIDWA